MQVKVGSKTTEILPNGFRYPAVAISDETTRVVTIINRTTGLPVDINVTSAEFISLRENRDGEKYTALTTETIQFGYRPVMEPRFNSIVGLDATENGEKLGLQALVEAHGATHSAWLAKNFEARRGATAAADL